MRHLGWIGLNVGFLFGILFVSFIAFGYLIMAEEFGSQHIDYNPDKELFLFSVYSSISGLLSILLSKYQKGTYISKSLISLSIVLIQVLYNLYPMTFFEQYYPLTAMRLVTATVSIVVSIFCGHDIIINYRKAKKYIRRRNRLLHLKVLLRRQ